MSKTEMVAALVKILAQGDEKEACRLTVYHMKRSKQEVRESWERWRAASEISEAEIALHCQLSGLPRL